MSRPGRLALAVLAALALVAGCSTAKDSDTPTPPPDLPELSWQSVSVPAPPGGPGRVVVRTTATCDGRWYLGGGVADAAGETRPAVWSSPDGLSWSPVATAPISFYGRQNIIYALACKGAALAAVGAKSGGVHGNPRISSWRLGPDGVLAEMPSAFTLFGGSSAVNVARMSAGSTGFMITGNRVSGAAVWTSPDAAVFEIHEDVKPLASDPGLDASASDVIGLPDGGWVVVGGGTPAGRAGRDPVVWASADGVAWQRTVLPGSGDYDELQRVTVTGDGLIAVGVRGAAFGAWRRPVGSQAWEALGSFGVTRPPAKAGGGAARPATALSVSFAAGLLLATVSDGQEYQLWASPNGGRDWTRAPQPATQPAASDSAAAVAAAGGRWLYLSDDAASGRVWATDGNG